MKELHTAFIYNYQTMKNTSEQDRKLCHAMHIMLLLFHSVCYVIFSFNVVHGVLFSFHNVCAVDCVWNMMAHVQKPDFVFCRNGQVHLNRRGRQFSRLLAAEVCTSALVMLDIPRSKVVWRVLATHSIHQFPLHFPSRASPCDIKFQTHSTLFYSMPWILHATFFPCCVFGVTFIPHCALCVTFVPQCVCCEILFIPHCVWSAFFFVPCCVCYVVPLSHGIKVPHSTNLHSTLCAVCATFAPCSMSCVLFLFHAHMCYALHNCAPWHV
jgi:hypothetical protein